MKSTASEPGLNLLQQNNCTTFSGEKKRYIEAFPCVYFLRIRALNLNSNLVLEFKDL